MDEQSKSDLRFVALVLVGAVFLAILGFVIEHWAEIEEAKNIILK